MNFESEIAVARAHIAARELDAAMGHLERAHVIGQLQVWPHVLSHWLMMQVELQRGRVGAAFGQFLRIVLGAVGSALGVVPNGNTGGSDISMFQRLPVPSELQAAIDAQPRNRFAQSALIGWIMSALLAVSMIWPASQLMLHRALGLERHFTPVASGPYVLAALALAVLLSSPALLPVRRAAICKLLAVVLTLACFFFVAPALAFGFGLLSAKIHREAGAR